MRIWAVANQKGGVGKTTTVVSLGGHLALRGLSTLVVDLDPHGSMTAYFGNDPDQMTVSLYELFKVKGKSPEEVNSLIQKTRFANLSLLPASTALATLDRQLGSEDGMGLILARALRAIADRYDFVLVDCPPQLGVLMVNALAACEHLIIPVQTEFLALKGLERMQRTLVMMEKALHRHIAYTILPTMFDQRTRASFNTLGVMKERYSQFLWQSVIPVDTQFREASRMGIPLPMAKPWDRGTSAYAAFLDDLLDGNSGQIATAQQVG